MSSPQRRQEKKQRRQKRLERRQRRQRDDLPPLDDDLPAMEQALTELVRHLEVPEPKRWPGACDATLARPDHVKVKLADFATEQQATGRRKLYELTKSLRDGLLSFLPNLDHWAVDEFPWHRLPPDPWQPVRQS